MNQRPRRNRKSYAIRNMVKETDLSISNLIYPFFLVDGSNIKDEISSMPNIYRWSADLLLKEIEECLKLGITNFVLFPAVEDSLKDTHATYSYNSDNFYPQRYKLLKHGHNFFHLRHNEH